MHIEVSDRWRRQFPGAHIGLLLVANVDNTAPAPLLEQRKRALEARLRARFAGSTRAELLELPVLQAYRAYYKRFGKTYHVQLQLESVVHHGKALPAVSPLVDANFAAELETLVLTAGHDADLLAAPVTVDATLGGEPFVQRNGETRALKANDMLMSDGASIVCTILYGQDARTLITSATRRALYVAYAPAGVARPAVQQQLEVLWSNVLCVAPDAERALATIIEAAP